MKKSKIIIDPFVINKISNSNGLKNKEKVQLLKYVWYLTNSEKKQLAQII